MYDTLFLASNMINPKNVTFWFVYFNKLFDYIFYDYYVVILQDDDIVIWKYSWLVMLW